MTKALFLDRDGVINVDHGYVYRKEDFQFVDGIFSLVQRFSKAGYKIVVVTNQSGIARGLYSEEDFHSLSTWMCEQFSGQGITIDGVFYCPHHPDKGGDAYRQQCDCRKPAPGMFLQAQRALALNLAESVMIGDKLSDLAASRAAGLNRHILFAYSGNPYLEADNQQQGIEMAYGLGEITP